MPRRTAIKLAAVVALAAAVVVLLSSDGSDESRASGGYYPGPSGQAAAADGITVTGVGQAQVQRPVRLSDATIGAAVAAAQRAAVPKAVADARTHAEAIARSLGLTIGSVEAVAETTDQYSAGVSGRFGTARHCGVISRRSFARDATGRRVLRRTRKRKCIVPRQSAVTLTVRYEKG